jgi:universal stress protein A
MAHGSAAQALLLVPVDFSETSRAAFEYALDLAGALPGRIRLLHVWDPLLGFRQHGLPSRHALEDARATAERSLAEWCAVACSRGVDCVPQLEAGPPAKSIVHVASEIAADLIVIGARGADATPEVTLGSVADRVLRLARCPVLCLALGSQFPPGKVVVGLDLGPGCPVLVEFAHWIAGENGGIPVSLVHVIELPAPRASGQDLGPRERYLELLERDARGLLEQKPDPSEVRHGSPASELADASGLGNGVAVLGSRSGGHHAEAIRRAVLSQGATVLSVPL